MKYRWLILSGFGLAACMANNALEYNSVALTTQYHLAKIRKGMSEKQVLQIMHKPYNYETYCAGEDVYDIWFYVSRTTGLDQSRMVPQNLTPLTFKNGVLVGTGYNWYYYAVQAEAEECAKQNPPLPKPKSQDEEDKAFERALRPYPEQTASPAQPKTPPPQPPAPIQPKPAVPAQPKQPAPVQPKPPVPAPQKPTPTAPMKKQTASLSLPLSANLLSKVRTGMTEEEVTEILGDPPTYETYHINQDVYDVWFYGTGKKQLPLTFKNGVLVGVTSRYYKKIKESAPPDQIRGYTQEDQRMKEDESEQNFDYW